MFSLRQLTTREGDEPKTLTGISYPFDSKNRPELFKLDVNRDEAYMSKVFKPVSKTHSWCSQVVYGANEFRRGKSQYRRQHSERCFSYQKHHDDKTASRSFAGILGMVIW